MSLIGCDSDNGLCEGWIITVDFSWYSTSGATGVAAWVGSEVTLEVKLGLVLGADSPETGLTFALLGELTEVGEALFFFEAFFRLFLLPFFSAFSLVLVLLLLPELLAKLFVSVLLFSYFSTVLDLWLTNSTLLFPCSATSYAKSLSPSRSFPSAVFGLIPVRRKSACGVEGRILLFGFRSGNLGALLEIG